MSVKPLHIVQIGFDDTVFLTNAPSDTLNRQLSYGRKLSQQCPGSRMSFVVLTGRGTAGCFERENVLVVPVIAPRRQRLLKLYAQLAALHREMSLDAIATQTIHAEAWIALWFGLRHRINVVGQIHYDFFSPIAREENLGRGLRGRVYAAACLWMLRRMVAVRVVGTRVQRQLIEKGLHRNVHVIPVPVTMPSEQTDEMRVAPSRRVLFVGRLATAKNLARWLQVAALVAAHDDQVTFQIVGDGALRVDLEKQSKRLGLNARVDFSGAVPYADLPRVYRSARVFLLTSSYEGFGLVAVEAYLNGVPVVAPRITGIEDIVEDGVTGFLHAPGDVVGMARSVLRLLNDDTLCAQMAQRGRDVVRAQFDPERLTRAWVSLLISAARERKR